MSNTDPCPGCGAEYRPYSLDGPYDCGTVIIAGQVIWGKECLRRQLAVAEARISELQGLLRAYQEHSEILGTGFNTLLADLAAAPANPYAAVIEAARALAVTLYQHNEAAIKRFHIEVLGREGEIDDDEGDCCEICCEVSDLLYDLGQKLGEIGIDDLSKIPDIRDLAKLDEEADACDL